MDDYIRRLFRRKISTLIMTALVLLVGWLLKLLGI